LCVPPWLQTTRLAHLDWWHQEIFRDAQQRVLTRKTLVASLRDQDGGSHFDSDLTEPAYRGVAKENSAGGHFRSKAGDMPVAPGPRLASMRQIAWELNASLCDVVD